MRRSRIFCKRERERERGGGSKPNGEKTALIFFMFVFGFLGQNFPGMREGVQLFMGGGGGSKC